MKKQHPHGLLTCHAQNVLHCISPCSCDPQSWSNHHLAVSLPLTLKCPDIWCYAASPDGLLVCFAKDNLHSISPCDRDSQLCLMHQCSCHHLVTRQRHANPNVQAPFVCKDLYCRHLLCKTLLCKLFARQKPVAQNVVLQGKVCD